MTAAGAILNAGPMAYRKAASLALYVWVAVMMFTEAHAAAAFNLSEVADGVFPMMMIGNKKRETLANVWPKPVKKLCA